MSPLGVMAVRGVLGSIIESRLTSQCVSFSTFAANSLYVVDSLPLLPQARSNHFQGRLGAMLLDEGYRAGLEWRSGQPTFGVVGPGF